MMDPSEEHPEELASPSQNDSIDDSDKVVYVHPAPPRELNENESENDMTASDSETSGQHILVEVNGPGRQEININGQLYVLQQGANGEWYLMVPDGQDVTTLVNQFPEGQHYDENSVTLDSSQDGNDIPLDSVQEVNSEPPNSMQEVDSEPLDTTQDVNNEPVSNIQEEYSVPLDNIQEETSEPDSTHEEYSEPPDSILEENSEPEALQNEIDDDIEDRREEIEQDGNGNSSNYARKRFGSTSHTVQVFSNGFCYQGSSTSGDLPAEKTGDEMLQERAVAASDENTDAYIAFSKDINVVESQTLDLNVHNQDHADANLASDTDEEGTDVASEQDSRCSSLKYGDHDEGDTISKNAPYDGCISSSQKLNTVSVIHTMPSTQYNSDTLKNDVDNSTEFVTSSVIDKMDGNIADNEQSNDSSSDLHIDFSQDDSGNKDGQLLNHDEHSKSSPNCDLDLAVCEDLNKEKEFCVDTSANEKLDVTRSTNVTEDTEAVTENISKCLGSNVMKGDYDGDLSSGKMCPEVDDNIENDLNLIRENSHNNVKSLELANETSNLSTCLIDKSEHESFSLPPDDNTDSHNSAFSEHVPSPSLLRKELISMKSDLCSSSNVKKGIDTYSFHDSSTEQENDSNNQQTLLDNQNINGKFMENENSKVTSDKKLNSVNGDNERSLQKLTFKEALITVLDKNEDTNKKDGFQNSSELFKNSSKISETYIDIVDFENSEERSQTKASSLPENAIANVDKSSIDEVSCDPISSTINFDLDNMDTEKSLVKTPTKVYFNKRKVKKDKCDVLPTNDKSCVYDQKKNDSIFEDLGMDVDDIPSNIQSRVSATYKRKQKSEPIVSKKKRSLRSCTSQPDKSLNNDAVDSSLSDQLDSIENVDSEETNWGTLLLKTQFCANTTLPESPLESSASPSNSQPSRERKKPSWLKMETKRKSLPASGKQFDKLIKSSPTKVKGDSATDKKKLTAKVKKQAMSLCKDSSQPVIFPPKRGRPKGSTSKSSSTPKQSPLKSKLETPNKDTANNKETRLSVKYLVSPVAEKEVLAPAELGERYPCTHCSFVGTRLNNLLTHMKLCSSKLDYQYSHKEVPDPKKLQLLRGDGASGYLNASEGKPKNKRAKLDPCNGTVDDNQNQSSFSFESRRDCEKDNDYETKEKFGFAENDVVWIKRGRWHWPALVWDINDKETKFYVINSSNKCEALTISSKSFSKLVHSFDDVTWGRTLLENAKTMKNHSTFIVAVQKANSYIRKKLLSDTGLDASKYFNIKDKSKVTKSKKEKTLFKEVKEGDKNEEYKSESLDLKKVMQKIWDGECDEHVVSLHKESIPCKRHELFKKGDPSNELDDIAWFGPIKNDSNMCLKLYDYFYDLYKLKVKSSPDMSYINKVWIPEAIIKAISKVNNLTYDEAEIIYLKEDI